jgi:hypothetical protein
MCPFFKTIQCKKPIYHVVYLDGKPAIRTGLKGPRFSCSLHPDAWRQIARLGDAPAWRIRKKNPITLVDCYRIENLDVLLAFAQDKGLIVPVTLFKSIIESNPDFDDDEDYPYCLFESKTEALAESDQLQKSMAGKAARL